MVRLLTLMMILGVMVSAGQVTNVRTPDLTGKTPDLTGLNWRDMTLSQKMIFMSGAMVGSDAEDVFQNVSMTRPHHRGMARDLVREIDNFYDVVANVPIPVWAALVYTHMKLDGTPKEALAVFLTNTRQVVAAPRAASVNKPKEE